MSVIQFSDYFNKFANLDKHELMAKLVIYHRDYDKQALSGLQVLEFLEIIERLDKMAITDKMKNLLYTTKERIKQSRGA